MDTHKILKKIVSFQKHSFYSCYNAMCIIQDQAASTANTMTANWIPDEGRQALKNLESTYKKGRDLYIVYVEENYSNLERFFFSEHDKPKPPSKESPDDTEDRKEDGRGGGR